MKKTIIFIITLMSASVMAESYDVAKCYNIPPSDLRQQCLASARNTLSYCYNIKDKDQQQFCKAGIQKNRSTCYNIKDYAEKQSCLAGMPYAGKR